MNNKYFKPTSSYVFLVALSLALSAAVNQVQAVEIEINQYGVTRFWQDKVLGRNTKDESRDTRDKTDNERRAVRVNNQPGVPTNQTRPMRVVMPSAKQVIEIEPGENSQSTVRIRDQYHKPAVERETQARMEKKEEIKDDRVELKAQLKSQIKHQAKLTEVQVRSRMENQVNNKEPKVELEIESGAVKTRTGATVRVDPESKQLQLVTPSGQTHLLQHLPDEAVAAMQASGKLQTNSTKPLTTRVEVAKDGKVEYSTQFDQEKKLFGLFHRNVRRQVKLDDQSGQVVTTPIEQQNPLTKILDALSF